MGWLRSLFVVAFVSSSATALISPHSSTSRRGFSHASSVRTTPPSPAQTVIGGRSSTSSVVLSADQSVWAAEAALTILKGLGPVSTRNNHRRLNNPCKTPPTHPCDSPEPTGSLDPLDSFADQP